jgi:predicted DNA-binding transcriptional regulator YafY
MSETLLRYIEVLKLLSRDRKLSSSEIHQRLAQRGYCTSKRTIERDLQMLSIPFGLESDDRSKPFGWKYGSNVAVNPLPGLSEPEALSFLMLKQFSERLLPDSIHEDLKPYFKEAARKLSAEVSHSAVRNWPGKVRSIEPHQPLLRPRIDSQVQREVHAALLRGKQVQITYLAAGDQEVREYATVNLLALVESGAVLYLVATFFEYQDIRLLALHRIQSVSVLETDTGRPVGFDIDAYIASGAFGFGGDAKEIKLEIRLFNGRGRHLLETPLTADQLVRKIDDSTLAITATVLDTRRLRWWLLGFGGDVEVVRPVALRKYMRQEILAATARYR